tara:strand:+ start:1778 stop:3502 length:1725 start_codon:yes stop_codon:yes gene_type:complete
MKKYTIGLDYGTNSCRALIVDISNGTELASSVFLYPSGENGIILDSSDPNLARQNPKDYLDGITATISGAIQKAKKKDSSFDSFNIVGIGVDTTGSSPIPVDKKGNPLSFLDKFKNNPNAMCWLWRDHTSFKEAEQITLLAKEIRPAYLDKIGGTYSSEWYWSKILHCKNIAPDVFDEAYSFVELCDYIPAVLTGEINPNKIKRSVCAAGHKAMYSTDWKGLPDIGFIEQLDSKLLNLRQNLFDKVYTSETEAGKLNLEWSKKLNLKEGISIAVGAFDAHMGAVGAGVKEGTLVKIMGTSTCDIMVQNNKNKLNDIPGVCGVVDGSVMEGHYGIEAGQSAVGDIFLWFVNHLTPSKYGTRKIDEEGNIDFDEKFENLQKEAEKLLPGESGLMALDWNNGNRTILTDVRLTGLMVGQTLHTSPHEIFRALVEATAFGALKIINRIKEYDVEVKEIVNCGGLAIKSPFLMQIYADVTGIPMKVSKSHQTPALGAAIFGAISAGEFKNVSDAQDYMTGTDKTYNPIAENHDIYKKLYKIYSKLHDSFGTKESSGSMYNIMKDLLNIRDSQRRVKGTS